MEGKELSFWSIEVENNLASSIDLLFSPPFPAFSIFLFLSFSVIFFFPLFPFFNSHFFFPFRLSSFAAFDWTWLLPDDSLANPDTKSASAPGLTQVICRKLFYCLIFPDMLIILCLHECKNDWFLIIWWVFIYFGLCQANVVHYFLLNKESFQGIVTATAIIHGQIWVICFWWSQRLHFF